MRFRLFHVLLMGDAVWASGGGGVSKKKNSNMSLAMKKYAHTFSIQILQGQNRGDGHMSGAALWRVAAWLHVHVPVRTCLWEGATFLLLNDPLFSGPPVCTSAVTIVILMVPPQQKGHVRYPTLLISTWQSAAAADRALLSLAEG